MSIGKQCRHAVSAHRGWVTNQPQIFTHEAADDKSRPLIAVRICDREQCIANAKRYVAADSNETAVWVPFPERAA